MSKPTSGNWIVQNQGPGCSISIIADNGKFPFLAHLIADDIGNEKEAMSNALVMAASKDLLEALKKAYVELNTIRARDGVPYTYDGWRSSVDEDYFSSVVDEARAAIAKAEGGNK